MRIPTDYFKRLNPLERGKLWLTGVAVVAALGWVGLSLVRGERGDKLFSRGPVARVHAAWDQNCAACHVDFNPITKQNFLTSAATRAASDERCESCHSGAAHHASQKTDAVPGCAGCHRDHRGFDASLVLLPDADCTSCHTNLKEYVQGGQPRFVDRVTAFAESAHPEFRVFRDKLSDPGVIKFNHALHMRPGQVKELGQKDPWTLAKIKAIDPASYERYRGATWQKDPDNENAPVVLDCRSCHQFDSGDVHASRDSIRRVPSAVLPSRAEGAYPLPIVYDVHCKACHPLRFDDKKPEYVAPHRYQPDELRKIIERTYAEQCLTDNPEVLELPVTRPLPGKSLAPAKQRVKDCIDKNVALAMDTLFIGKKTCGECHYAEHETDEPAMTKIPKRIQVGPTAATRAAGWFTNESSIPDVWFLHAKFNHSAHRAVDCRSCHEQAYPLKADGSPKKDDETSRSAKDILVPKMDNCVQCHAPPRSEGGLALAGVRHDCTECHRYHHGDRPLQALGAQALDPVHRIDIQKFLRGAPTGNSR